MGGGRRRKVYSKLTQCAEEEEEDEEEDAVHATGRFRPSFIHKVPNTSLSPFSPTLKRARSFFVCDLERARLCV